MVVSPKRPDAAVNNAPGFLLLHSFLKSYSIFLADNYFIADDRLRF